MTAAAAAAATPLHDRDESRLDCNAVIFVELKFRCINLYLLTAFKCSKDKNYLSRNQLPHCWLLLLRALFGVFLLLFLLCYVFFFVCLLPFFY